jgi:hypothetical protein
MRFTLRVSKASKFLGLNKYEHQPDYEDSILLREFNILTPNNHSYFNNQISLPEMSYIEKELRNPEIKYKNNKYYANRCDFGTDNENYVVKHLNKNGYCIKDSQKLYKYDIPDTNFRLIGKVDGLRTYAGDKQPRLLEIKSRCSSFSGIRPTEYIQIQLYLLITGLKTADVVECHNNKLKRFIVHMDDVYLNALMFHMKAFIEHLESTRKAYGK